MIARLLLLALVGGLMPTAFSGCATYNTLRHGAPATPKVYAGTRLNLAVLREDEQTLRELAAYGIFPPDYPWPLIPVINPNERQQSQMDFPASVFADTLLLPLTVPYVAYHRVVHPPQ